MSIPKAAHPQPLKRLPREVRERHWNKLFVPNPWTPADDAAADFILSKEYDPIEYAEPIHTDGCASKWMGWPELATSYTFRGEGNGEVMQ